MDGRRYVGGPDRNPANGEVFVFLNRPFWGAYTMNQYLCIFQPFL